MTNSHANTGDTPEELYIRGIEYLNRPSWGQAVATFRKLILIDPSCRDAWQKLEEAKREARKFEDLEDLYSVSSIYLEKQQWEVAIVYLEQIRDSGEEYRDTSALLDEAETQLKLEILYAKADAQLEEEKWKEAIEILEEIASIDQNYRDSDAKLGEAQARYRLQGLFEQVRRHFREERWPQAIRDLNTILRENPGNPDAAAKLKEAQEQQELAALYSAGVGFQETRKWEEATDKYREILRRVRSYGDVVARLHKVERLQRLDKDRSGRISRLRESATASTALQRLDKDRSGRITFVELLRDPIMQGIGVIVALVSVAIAVLALRQANIPNSVTSTPTPTLIPTNPCNGDFDDNFECWQHGGELDQDVKCEAGDCYAILGNPNYDCHDGVPVGDAWISQTVRVPQVTSPTLTLRYRVRSYDLDLPDYDYFQVAIGGEPFSERHGNHKWVEPSCDREPWDSGWQTLALDLSPYRGEVIELSLYNVNGTHRYYNTWTYVDDVRMDEVN